MRKRHFLAGCLTPVVLLSFNIASAAEAVTTETQQSTEQSALSAPSRNVYIGVFGGGGNASTSSISQSGTALYSDPLTVNAKNINNASDSAGMVGLYVGYQWPALFKKAEVNWSVTPAIELEGYYLGSTLNATLDNETDRLPEHQFDVSYPMNTGVFLTNARFTVNYDNSKAHPYLALGVGPAIIAIDNATSTQIAPPESVNHYNSDPNASDWALAAQSKLGVRYEIMDRTSVFAEYRFLLLSSTSYTFGSTQYDSHAATTPWTVDIGTQYYNMAVAGIQYDV